MCHATKYEPSVYITWYYVQLENANNIFNRQVNYKNANDSDQDV